MATPKAPFTRETLVDFWRMRVEETQAYYRKATEEYRRLLEERLGGTPHDPNGALALARQVESDALAEYCRVLRAFTDLTVNGKMPEQPAAPNGL
jgi:hypothetical protein